MARNRKRVKAPWPVWKLVVMDVLALGLALVVFALFHHVLPRQQQAVGIVSQRVRASTQAPVGTQEPQTPEPAASAEAQPADASASAQVTPEPTPEATATPSPTPDPVGYFGTKFADKFTDGEIINTGTTYQSANINVTMTQFRKHGTEIYMADVYVKDISCLQTAFGKDTFGQGYYERVQNISERKGAIVTTTGDFYGGRSGGLVIRNGVLYRDTDYVKRDACVLYWDGSMECFGAGEFDAEYEMSRGAYQAWNFGPMLLDENGEAMREFNSSVEPANPRSAIGYFEPGHYCLIVVDGRTSKSNGISLRDLSALMKDLGCAAAYNLDGGATAAMACGGKLVSKPAEGGRSCSDFIMIMDEIGGANEEGRA